MQHFHTKISEGPEGCFRRVPSPRLRGEGQGEGENAARLPPPHARHHQGGPGVGHFADRDFDQRRAAPLQCRGEFAPQLERNFYVPKYKEQRGTNTLENGGGAQKLIGDLQNPRHILVANVFDSRELFLRKQLAFYQEHKQKPQLLTDVARWSLVLWSRLFDWRSALVIVKPDTLIGWHRKGFQRFWRCKSRPGHPSRVRFAN